AAWSRAAQIQHGHHVSGPDAPERSGRAPHAHVDGGGHLVEQLKARRYLLQLERHPQTTFDGFLARHDHPHQQREPQRQQLQPEVTKRPDHQGLREPHVYWTSRAGGTFSRPSSTSVRSRTRSSSASSPRSICPSTTIEMLPVSSDTTIATESFSSVRPIAARWRDPRSLPNFGFTVSGRKHAAAATLSSCTMTAPSCSGDCGRKMLCRRS